MSSSGKESSEPSELIKKIEKDIEEMKKRFEELLKRMDEDLKKIREQRSESGR